jgi:pimeloyl-ACP methyl ester carboxylesterase
MHCAIVIVAVSTVAAALVLLLLSSGGGAGTTADYNYDRQHRAARQTFLDREFPAGTASVHCFSINRINVTVVRHLSSSVLVQHQTPPVLFVHGIGSSAALILSSSAARSLHASHDLYAVDVPGLVGGANDDAIAAMSADEYLALFAAVLDRLLLVYLPAPPIIVAHSLGAFLVSEAVSEEDGATGAVAGLVLVSAAGMMPGMGVLGPVWTLFFRTGMPGALLRPFARTWLLWPEAAADDETGGPLRVIWHARNDYWTHVQAAAPHANVAAKFIAGWTPFAAWTRPQLDRVLRRADRVPTALVWGEEDVLAPMNSNDLRQRVVAAVAAVEVMPDVGHSVLLHPDSGAVLRRALDRVCAAGSSCSRQ